MSGISLLYTCFQFTTNEVGKRTKIVGIASIVQSRVGTHECAHQRFLIEHEAHTITFLALIIFLRNGNEVATLILERTSHTFYLACSLIPIHDDGATILSQIEALGISLRRFPLNEPSAERRVEDVLEVIKDFTILTRRKSNAGCRTFLHSTMSVLIKNSPIHQMRIGCQTTLIVDIELISYSSGNASCIDTLIAYGVKIGLQGCVAGNEE